jgi:hypothetical protein
MKKTKKRCFLINDRCRHTVDKIARREKGLIPIMKGKGRVCEKSKTCFY